MTDARYLGCPSVPGFGHPVAATADLPWGCGGFSGGMVRMAQFSPAGLSRSKGSGYDVPFRAVTTLVPRRADRSEKVTARAGLFCLYGVSWETAECLAATGSLNGTKTDRDSLPTNRPPSLF